MQAVGKKLIIKKHTRPGFDEHPTSAISRIQQDPFCAWQRYTQVRETARQLQTDKKIEHWQNMVAKVNTCFTENRKLFWEHAKRLLWGDDNRQTAAVAVRDEKTAGHRQASG